MLIAFLSLWALALARGDFQSISDYGSAASALLLATAVGATFMYLRKASPIHPSHITTMMVAAMTVLMSIAFCFGSTERACTLLGFVKELHHVDVWAQRLHGNLTSARSVSFVELNERDEFNVAHLKHAIQKAVGTAYPAVTFWDISIFRRDGDRWVEEKHGSAKLQLNTETTAYGFVLQGVEE